MSLDENPSLGLLIKRGVGRRIPSTYLTDLGLADDIALLSEDDRNAQLMLSSIEKVALQVGLKVNVKKTEFILVVSIQLSSGAIKQVKDFKYLGSWLMNSMADFKMRKELAWTTCIRLIKIWKSKLISRRVKLRLFLACVELTLLYNAVSWTMTNTFLVRLDGCYTRLLRFALGYTWNDFVSNSELYGCLSKVSKTLLERKLRFAGHCARATDQPISELLFWDHSRLVRGKCSKGAGGRANYAKRL